MSKRSRQKRKRRKAKRLGTVKVRSPMPPPCQCFGDARKQASKTACRGRFTTGGSEDV
jgi:hypothetical protein